MDCMYQLNQLLSVIASGEEACAPSHSYGPAMRGYHLMHLVLSGNGVFQNGCGQFEVHAGEGFMIFPKDITIYAADARTPWHYVWVGYSGESAAAFTHNLGLSPENPVLRLGDCAASGIKTIQQIYADTSRLKWSDAAATGGLLRLFALIEQGRTADAPINIEDNESFRRALWFINANFQRANTHVEDVARFVNLSRSQLFRIFKAQSGQSPQQTLGEMRLNRARQLLTTTSLSLKEVALSSGFASAARMGEIFRESLNTTPTQYRIHHQQD